MKFWLCDHSWEDYKKTTSFVGFESKEEFSALSLGDRIVYSGNGLVAGIFEAEGFAGNEYSGWQSSRPFQVRLKPLNIPQVDLVAKPLRYKVRLEKPFAGKGSLYRLSEQEYKKIELAILEGKRELVY